MNKFLFRKVLALVVAAIAVVAVYFYTDTTIKSELAPVSVVVAVTDIPPHTEITQDMVRVVEDIPLKALPSEHSYATKYDDVVGKWTVEGYGITAKGYVNTKKIIEKEDLPDSGLLELKKGEYAFSTEVDLETSHGNTIRPGTKVDLYLSAKFSRRSLTPEMVTSQGWDGSSDFMSESVYYFGRIAVEARVIEVKDNSGKKVFTAEEYTDTAEAKKASNRKKSAKLYTLAVSLDDLQLLNKGKLIGDIIPVVSGTSYNKIDLDLGTGNSIPEYMSDVKETVKVIQGVTLEPSKTK